MARLVRTVLVLLIVAGLGFAVFQVLRHDPEHPEPHPLADAVFVISGRPTTCADLLTHPCDYTLQTQYNQWGARLEQFLTTSPLGPYADRIGFAASAKLSLQACALSRTVGKTFLEFVAVAHVDNPDATSPELFPFWNRTRQSLCPSV
ncbi:hypothetical protein R1CP_20010 [Rhodococcus opacus]|uniref:DUF732 domain-containing protein n=1 Tax=Rhodococcus opacus TaxID=37919 RepID=A0A1B1K7T6_RHOOP|nr:hypothetical protein [Rhodococcus opacus]ANS28684.1 hypothetical protein R1CP_20010 [Rhodococcus opacus]